MKAILNCYDTSQKARHAFDMFVSDNAYLIPGFKVYLKDLRVELPSDTAVFFREVTESRVEHAVAGREFTWVTFDHYSAFSTQVRALCWSRVRLP